MKCLVYFNNGLVETDVLLIADSVEHATQIFKEEMLNDESFKDGNCLGKCEFIRTEQV